MNAHPAGFSESLGPGVDAGPGLWLVLTVLLGVSLLTAGLMQPLVGPAYAAETPELAGTIRTGLWLAGALGPVLAVAKAGVLGGVAWAVLVLGGREARYRRLFRALVLAELILVAQGLWVAGVLHVLGGVSSPLDLRVGTGLDVLFPDPSTSLGALATVVTPFHAAWVAFLAWRFAVVTPSGPGLGTLAALACWLPGALLATVRTWG